MNHDSIFNLNKCETIETEENSISKSKQILNNNIFNSNHANNEIHNNIINQKNVINAKNIKTTNITNAIVSPLRKSSLEMQGNIIIKKDQNPIKLISNCPCPIPDDRYSPPKRREMNEKVAIKALVLPRINTPSIKSNFNTNRAQVNYELNSNENFNNIPVNRYNVQKSLK
jgi:hypothetical protein